MTGGQQVGPGGRWGVSWLPVVALSGVMGHGGDAIPLHLSFPTDATSFSEISFRKIDLINPILGQKVPSRIIFYKMQTHLYIYFKDISSISIVSFPLMSGSLALEP